MCTEIYLGWSPLSISSKAAIIDNAENRNFIANAGSTVLTMSARYSEYGQRIETLQTHRDDKVYLHTESEECTPSAESTVSAESTKGQREYMDRVERKRGYKTYRENSAYIYHTGSIL